MRSWEDLRAKLGFDGNKTYYWKQIIHAIPCAWKEMFLEYGSNISDLTINEYHLIKKHQLYCLEKVNNRELYTMKVTPKVKKSTAQTYLEKHFQNLKLKWKDIYIYIPYLDVQQLIQIFAYYSINHYIIFYILTKCFTNLEKRYPHFSLFT